MREGLGDDGAIPGHKLLEAVAKQVFRLVAISWLLAWLLTKSSSYTLCNLPVAITLICFLRWAARQLDVRVRSDEPYQPSHVLHKGRNQPSRPHISNHKSFLRRSFNQHSAADHDAWRGMVNSKVVEYAWDKLCNSIVQEWIYDAWYSMLTADSEFPAELRLALNHCFGELCRRARRVDLRNVLVRQVSEVVKTHLELYRKTVYESLGDSYQNIPTAAGRERALLNDLRTNPKDLHIALQSEDGHYKVLKRYSEGIVNKILAAELQVPLIQLLVREIVATCVLRPVMYYFMPYNLNKLFLSMFETASSSTSNPVSNGSEHFEKRAQASADQEKLHLEQRAAWMAERNERRRRMRANSIKKHNGHDTTKDKDMATPSKDPQPRNADLLNMSNEALAASTAFASAHASPWLDLSSPPVPPPPIAVTHQLDPTHAHSDSEMAMDLDDPNPQPLPQPDPLTSTPPPAGRRHHRSASAGTTIPSSPTSISHILSPIHSPHPPSNSTTYFATNQGASSSTATALSTEVNPHTNPSTNPIVLTASSGASSSSNSQPGRYSGANSGATSGGDNVRDGVAELRVETIAPGTSSRGGYLSRATKEVQVAAVRTGFDGWPRARVVTAMPRQDPTANNKDFVVYQIRVVDNSGEWTVDRRFRNFEALHKKLRDNPKMREQVAPKLPAKRYQFMANGHNTEFVERRRAELDTYLSCLLSDWTVAVSEDVWEFLCQSSEVYGQDVGEGGLMKTLTSNMDFATKSMKKAVGDVFDEGRGRFSKLSSRVGDSATKVASVMPKGMLRLTNSPTKSRGSGISVEAASFALEVSGPSMSSSKHTEPASEGAKQNVEPHSDSSASSPSHAAVQAALTAAAGSDSSHPPRPASPLTHPPKSSSLKLKSHKSLSMSHSAPPVQAGRLRISPRKREAVHEPASLPPRDQDLDSGASMELADSAGISAPLYDVIDTLFDMQSRGFLRRQVIVTARQLLSLVAGDYVDTFLMSHLHNLRSEHTIARIILELQSTLWPGGIWFATAKPTHLQPEPTASGSAKSGEPERPSIPVMLPEKFVDVNYRYPDEEEVAAQVKARFLATAPATLVRLIGPKAYQKSTMDLYNMLQSPTFTIMIGYRILEGLIVALFPELEDLVYPYDTS